MSDERLDNLFKETLSARDVKFNMDSWRRMEHMLPPESKGSGFRFGWAASIIGALFVLSASVFVWSQLAVNSELASLNTSQSELHNKVDQSSIENEMLFAKEAAVEIETVTFNEKQRVITARNQALLVKENQKEVVGNPSNKGENTSKMVASFAKNNKNVAISSSNGFFANQNNNPIPVRYSAVQENAAMNQELEIAFDNAFTQIDGMNELVVLSTIDLEEENIIIADVSEGKRPRSQRNEIGFLGGININKSLVDDPTSGISGCEVFGIHYQRFLNGGLSIKTNLLYSARNEVNTVKLYDMKIYGFGSKTEQTTVESQKLVYLELPVMLNYGLGNHNLMAGAYVSYLVSGLHKVSTEYTTLTETSYEDNMQWGNTNGFNYVDVGIVAGYEYNVNPKLNLGMRLNYGLTDITNNSYFGTDSFDNNVQFRVYLTFAPFRF